MKWISQISKCQWKSWSWSIVNKSFPNPTCLNKNLIALLIDLLIFPLKVTRETHRPVVSFMRTHSINFVYVLIVSNALEWAFYLFFRGTLFLKVYFCLFCYCYLSCYCHLLPLFCPRAIYYKSKFYFSS